MVTEALAKGKVSEFGSPPPRLIIPGKRTSGIIECSGDGKRALLREIEICGWLVNLRKEQRKMKTKR